MPTFNYWRGDAQSLPLIRKWIASDAAVGDTFTVKIGNKSVSYTLTQADVDDATGSQTNESVVHRGVYAAFVALQEDIAEYAEVTLSLVADEDNANEILYIKATGPEDGKPFEETLSTGDAANLGVSVTEVVKGDPGTNEIQQVLISGTATGGTFTLTFDGQTTGNIDYDATAYDVRDALCDLSNIAGTDEVQVLTSTATGGTFTVTFEGQTTGNLAFDISAANLKTALEALSNVAVDDVECTGGPLNTDPIEITFKQALGRSNRTEMTVDNTNATGGTVVPSTDTDGVASDVTVTGSAGGPWSVEFGGVWTNLDVVLMTGDGTNIVKNPTGYSLTITTIQSAVAGVNEVQRVAIPSGTTGGTFTLTFEGQTTGNIAYDASAGTVETAFEALSTVDAVTVTKPSTGTWDIEFTGTHAYQNVTAISGSGASLTGSAGINVDTTQQGGPPPNLIWRASSSTGTFQFKIKRYSGGVAVDESLPFNFSTTDNAIVLQAKVDTALSEAGAASGDIVMSVTTSGSSKLWDFEVTGNFAGTASDDGQRLEVVRYNSTTGTYQLVTIHQEGGGDGPTEIQTVAITGSPTGGTFTLTFEGQTTAGMAYNADAATVDAALEALSNIESGEVSVTKSGWVYTITFSMSRDVAQLTGSAASLTGGGVTVSTTQQSVTPVNERQQVTINGSPLGGTFTLTWNGETTGNIDYDATASEVQTALEGLTTPGPGDFIVTGASGGPWVVEFDGSYEATNVASMTGDGSSLSGTEIFVSTTQTASDPVNEQQKVTLTGVPTGGTFTLTFESQTTSAISYNATAAIVQASLEALSTIDIGEIAVSGSAGGPWTIDFQGGMAGIDAAAISGSGASLTSTGTQDFVASTLQSASGPNWANLAGNWSLGHVLADDEIAILEDSSISLLYGLDLSEVTPEAWIQKASFTGSVGLPRWTGTYWEYRDTELSLGGDGDGSNPIMLVEIGAGEGQGSARTRINTNDKKTELVILNSDASSDGSVPSICWRGTNSANVVRHRKGSLGIGYFKEAATVATLEQSYSDSVETDASLVIGDQVTLGTVIKTGGSAKIDCSFDSLFHSAGDMTLAGEGDVGDIRIEGGTVYSETTGKLGVYGAITAATAANPCVITSAGHGRSTGDKVRINGVAGMTELNGIEATIERVDADSFKLLGVNSTSYTAYSSGGYWGLLASIEVLGEGVLDFEKSLVERQVAVAIDVYGDDALVRDSADKVTTLTFETGQFALQFYDTDRFGPLGGRSKLFVRQ